ncbi:MAG: carbon storage regulator [Pirellulales bacterium]
MLVLTRKRREKIVIGDNIEVTVSKVGRGQVTLAVSAPANVPVDRGEVWLRKHAEMPSVPR